jgi:hypothetical protein
MQEITKFVGGIHTDSKAIFQPKGTLSFALNSTISAKEGDVSTRTNELGNVACLDLEPGYKIIGHKSIENKVILFITNGIDSIIGEKDRHCNFTELVKTSCLGFDSCKQVQCEFEIINGCERVIYFVDGINKDKGINLDRLSDYTIGNISNIDANDNPSFWDCSLFPIAISTVIPCVELNVLPSGGDLPLGVMQVAVQYADSTQNASNWLAHTSPISVSNKEVDYETTEGGLPSITGNTNSSLTVAISNLDTRYPYLNIAVAMTVEGVTTVYKITQRNINTTEMDFTFSGVNAAIDVEIPADELSVNPVAYDVSKTIKIHDNRLLRGNLLEKQIDWHLFQNRANLIETYYKTSANLHGDFATFNGYKNPKATFKKKSYLRDEIYALGIVWVFTDGYESPVMHIPGRELNLFPDGSTITYNTDPNKSGSALLNVNHTRTPLSGLSGQWDTYLDPAANIAEDLTINPTGVRHEIYNTAIRTEGVVNDFGPNTNSGIMGFHENDIDYPITKDCKGEFVYPQGKVRHHRMPDTTLEPHFNTDAAGNNFIIPLGLEFKNIIPPAEYASQIQGYYIVRAERSANNKTVLDKGIIYNNMVLYYDYDDNGNTVARDISRTDLTAGSTNVTTVSGNVSPNKYLYQPVGPNAHFDSSKLGGVNGNLPSKNVFISNDGDNGYIHTSHLNFSFYGANAKFNPDAINADFMKIEGVMQGSVGDWGRVKTGTGASGEFRLRTHESVDYSENNISNPFQMTNRLITDQVSLVPHLLGNINNTVFINDSQQETYAVEVDNFLMHANYEEADSQTVLNIAAGEEQEDLLYATTSKAFYASFKKSNSSLYGGITAISYIKASHCMHAVDEDNIEIFGGDTFITKFSFKKTSTTMHRTIDKRDGIWAQVLTMFVESDVNTELRHSIATPISSVTGETSETTYYPKQELVTFLQDADYNQFASTTSKGDAETAEVINGYLEGDFAANFYRYNKDYSKENTLKYYFGLSKTFNFCSDCLNYFPHKIIYSNKSLPDDSAQAKRIFLANSSTDIPTGFGELTNMFTDNDQLWIQSERSLFRQQTKPNEMNIGSSTVFVGVGEIFSIPPSQIRTIDTGYAGSKHKFATSTNEIGTYFVSADSGKIFLIQGGKLKDISMTGNSMWFYNNLPIKFEKQFEELTETEYPCIEGIANKSSVGFMSTYDYEYKRWILTKKDYKYIGEGSITYSEDFTEALAQSTVAGDLVFVVGNEDIGGGWFIRNNDSFDPDGGELFSYYDSTSFNNTALFQNLSWTLSFDGANLVGWHSYLPDYMFSTQNEFFTSKEDKIWTHNKGNYQTYYGIEHDHILEWIDNEDPTKTRTFAGLQYRQSCEKYDPTYETWVKDINHTFTKLVAYNDTDCTGELTILPKDGPYDSIIYTPTEALAFHKENLWRINQLRDYSVSPGVPNFTKQWALLEPLYPIDKVVNPVNINSAKSQYEVSRLRGKYLVIRAIFNNPDKTLKLNTELFNTEYDNSLR